MVKNILPIFPPLLPVKMPQHKLPPNRVVVARCRWPRPNHVWVNHVEKEVWIFGVPAFRFQLNQRLYLLLHCVKHSGRCEITPNENELSHR
jgi:hypothetical protein